MAAAKEKESIESESETGLVPAVPKKGKKDVKTTVHSGGVVKRKHRWHPGTLAKREIARELKSMKNAIPALPFKRIVREAVNEVAHELDMDDLRITESAFVMLQLDAEQFLNAVNTMAYRITRSRKQVTYKPGDLTLAMDIIRDLGHYQGGLKPQMKRTVDMGVKKN